MSSYAYLYVERTPLIAFRNHVEPPVMLLFTKADLRRQSVRGSDRPGIGYFPEDVISAVELSTTTDVLRDRLDVLGIGQEAVPAALAEGVAHRMSLVTAIIASVERSQEPAHKEAKLLASIDVDSWGERLRERMRVGALPSLTNHIPGDLGWLVELFGRADDVILLRALVDALPHRDFVLDVTQLVDGGWLQEGFDPQEAGRTSMRGPLYHDSPAIVLAEGRSDIDVLASATAVLRPHLEGFVRFTDFEMKAEGGAAALVKTVRAFAAAGVSNRVIAIFDNDTAGSEALSKLRAQRLPSNLTLLQYPPLDRARTYPTLGPMGAMETDVNGLACGIEMYLGDDILFDEEYGFRPIQWTGYNRALKRYQGELVDKSELLRRFKQKAAIALRDPSVRERQDWKGLAAIVDMVVDTLAGRHTVED